MEPTNTENQTTPEVFSVMDTGSMMEQNFDFKNEDEATPEQPATEPVAPQEEEKPAEDASISSEEPALPETQPVETETPTPAVGEEVAGQVASTDKVRIPVLETSTTA